MGKKSDNTFTWNLGNTFRENLDKIIILFMFLISSLNKKKIKKIDPAKDIDIYKEKLRNLREKGFLNQSSILIEDFYSELLFQILDKNKNSFSINEQIRIYSDFEKFAKVHVQDQIKGFIQYFFAVLIPIIFLILSILTFKTKDDLYIIFICAIAILVLLYYMIPSFLVYIGKIKNPETRYKKRDVNVKYCFDELNRLFDNLDSILEEKNSNVILIEQKMQAVLVNFHNVIELKDNDNALTEGFNKIQVSLDEIKGDISQLETKFKYNNKQDILKEMENDGLIHLVNDKYCTFGGLPKFLETIRYHEKEKYRRLAKEFYHTYIMGPDGQKFTDSYYDKIYREIFNH